MWDTHVMDPAFMALIRRQSVENGELLDELLRRHPLIELDSDDWTPEQEQTWEELSAPHVARWRAELDALPDTE